MAKMTPMLRQYRKLKQRYPDALLFYRLGDFYELFEDDAKTASRELNLVLTSRRFSKEVRLPLAPAGRPWPRNSSESGPARSSFRRDWPRTKP